MKILLKIIKDNANKFKIVIKEVDINNIKSIKKLKSIFHYSYIYIINNFWQLSSLINPYKLDFTKYSNYIIKDDKSKIKVSSSENLRIKYIRSY